MILILSGSHGTREGEGSTQGKSALTDKSLGTSSIFNEDVYIYRIILFLKTVHDRTFSIAAYNFYQSDCASVGFIPFEEKRNLPTNDLRNFNERNQKLGFQHDKILGELEFKVANIALYYGNQDRLVEHIKEVNL